MYGGWRGVLRHERLPEDRAVNPNKHCAYERLPEDRAVNSNKHCAYERLPEDRAVNSNQYCAYERLPEDRAVNSNQYCAHLVVLLSHFSRVRPQRPQPTRLPHPWNSPGRNTGAGCHCLLPVRPAESSIRLTASGVSHQ